jgi:hypothetical protein
MILAAWSIAGAKPVDLPSEKASLDVPDAWTVIPRQIDTYTSSPSLVLAAFNPEKDSAVEVLVCNNPAGLSANNPALITIIKNGLTNMVANKGGDTHFGDESSVQLNNVPAYRINYSASAPDHKPTIAFTYQVAANGRIYLISMQTVDPSKQSDIEAIASSFRFTDPPVLPTPRVSHHLLKLVLLGAAGLFVVAAIGGVVYYLRQRQVYG